MVGLIGKLVTFIWIDHNLRKRKTATETSSAALNQQAEADFVWLVWFSRANTVQYIYVSLLMLCEAILVFNDCKNWFPVAGSVQDWIDFLFGAKAPGRSCLLPAFRH